MKKTRNKFEEEVRRHLRKYRATFEYEAEYIPYIIARHYIPDFIIWTPLGKVYVECKGYLRKEDKSKLLAVRRTNPKLDIRLLFYEDKPIQVKWAIKNQFKYAIKEIPDEWLQGI